MIEDVAIVVEMLNDYQEHINGLRPWTTEDLHAGWTSPRFDIHHSTRIVLAAGGRVAAYASVGDTNPIPVKIWSNTKVHPDFQATDIGSILRQWVDQRVQETLTRVDEELQVVLLSGFMEGDHYGHALMTKHDMFPSRYWLRMSIMLKEAEIAEAKMPDGVVIQSWTEVEDKVTMEDIVRADIDGFRDHYGYTEQPFDEVLRWWDHWLKTDNNVDRELFFLAMNEADEIVAVCLNLTKSENVANWGYVDSLAVLPEWRRKGIAGAMLQHTFQAFQARDYERVDLHVDADSLTGATRVYERAGMCATETSVEFKKVLRLGRDIVRK